MAWYDEAVFYHIYPLGLAGAPKLNDYGKPVHRLNDLVPWIEHIRRLGFTALYIGPLFQSVGHGYETTDYRLLDTRLGTNDDLTAFVRACHNAGIKVVFDGVFNHTGRDFFAFRDIRSNREASRYRDWYCNVNFWGNNEYNDGFSYDNWGGYDLLAKLNQRNPEVRDYICDVIRFWVSEFDVDGIRLDAADVLDFEFMKALRQTADAVKPDFWLMGEVIHGDYSRWANGETLHSVTDYALHKGLFSGHNDHNYFEIAHTVRRTQGMLSRNIKLYNFVDNHDVERIATKLRNKAHYLPVHILLYTLPGIPSVYYGSEFGIEGRKERFSDDSLRPCIDLVEHASDYEDNPCTRLIAALGRVHDAYRNDLVWGDYRELILTTEQFAFARGSLLVAVNNADHEASLSLEAPAAAYVGLLGGTRLTAADGRLDVSLPACGGDIYAPIGESDDVSDDDDAASHLQDVRWPAPVKPAPKESVEAKASRESKWAAGAESANGGSDVAARVMPVDVPDIPYEEMSVEQLQSVILAKMASNGLVTDQMERDVANNVWHDSLVSWAKSFR